MKHGHQILAKRNLKKVELEQWQLLIQDQTQTDNLDINDPLNSLSINDLTNSNNNKLFGNELNEEFMHKYMTEYDEDDFDQSNDIPDDEEERCEEENFEKNLTEEQVEFANEFIGEETSEKTAREYDELVDIWVLNMLIYGFSLL